MIGHCSGLWQLAHWLEENALEPNYHKHKCHYCGFVWQHHDANDASHNAVPGAHECPSCHRCNWGLGIYGGSEEPRITNGISPPAALCMPCPIHPDQDHRSGD